jgi:hypothetical protein
MDPVDAILLILGVMAGLFIIELLLSDIPPKRDMNDFMSRLKECKIHSWIYDKDNKLFCKICNKRPMADKYDKDDGF